MYYIIYFLILIISLTNAQSSTHSFCTQYYPYDSQQQHQQCECEDISPNAISLKCTGHSYVPHFLPNIHYKRIEIESCSQDLQIGDKTFADLNINTLSLRSCNLIGLNEESFSKINHLEKFVIGNSTINSLSTSTGNFQDIFFSDSFKTLKSLTLKNVHYHQIHKHDKKFNLETLFNQLPQLNRLELMNIYLDNYRYHNITTTTVGQHLTYLKLISTHQTSLLPIEYLTSLESLILYRLPEVFRTQPLISSIKKLKKLKYIDFTQNQLVNIDDLQSQTIDQIDLSSNLIETIDEYTFEHVPKLRILTLTKNPLQYIDKNAFCGIENLTRLWINTEKQLHISPLDNCILLSHPTLDIKLDAYTKFQCNCQLVNIFHFKRRYAKEINRLFKPEQACIVTNNTIIEAKNSQQIMKFLNHPINIFELDNFLNCSLDNQCSRLCQERKLKPTTTTLSSNKLQKASGNVQKKTTSLSTSLYSFFSYTLFLLLFAILYL
ncbi:unnamed protein product [Adineta steineri]|uniref:Uncharacterized protein n=1 Tax=Adineta steineri TaxID=433720 RepID=A0A813NGI9_9BILA|nr:unnamed protein product [Adineta steineri]CAF1247503.1 unnamed protein product [Adineta steineri]